jgi:hypothetical protein
MVSVLCKMALGHDFTWVPSFLLPHSTKCFITLMCHSGLVQWAIYALSVKRLRLIVSLKNKVMCSNGLTRPHVFVSTLFFFSVKKCNEKCTQCDNGAIRRVSTDLYLQWITNVCNELWKIVNRAFAKCVKVNLPYFATYLISWNYTVNSSWN